MKAGDLAFWQRLARFPDSYLVGFFEGIECAQEAARLPRRDRELKALLQGADAVTLLALPSLRQQRLLPN